MNILHTTTLWLSAALIFSSCKNENDTGQQTAETSTGRVIQVDSDEPGMNAAMQKARDSFGVFWKAVSEDRDLPEPTITGSMIKVYFSDDSAPSDGEHLWVSNVHYDGKLITGVVQSEPLNLAAPKLGEQVTFPLQQLSDWLIVRNGKAEGAYTVQFLRKRMSKEKRAEHDGHYPFKFAPIE